MATLSNLRVPAVAKPHAAARRRAVVMAAAPKRAVNAKATAAEVPEALRSSHGPLYYTGTEFDQEYFNGRTEMIQQHFEGALGVDDFMNRVEMALYQEGFDSENTLALVNLCRDEVCHKLATKVHQVFGHSFTIHGLGGVLTCGVTGIKAGISHAPTDANGKEKYVFFAFPHIAIDSEGNVGNINRPGRVGDSSACGALCACLACFKSGDASLLEPSTAGTHDVTDPELSILKQRLVRTVKEEAVDPAKLDLVSITKLAERAQARDLKMLIDAAVDTNIADYAIVTGVQIHNWMAYPADAGAPDLEYVYPSEITVVSGGKSKTIKLGDVPSMTPRQVRVLAHSDSVGSGDPGSPLHNIDAGKRQRMVTNLIKTAFNNQS